MHVLPRTAEGSRESGLLTEALAVALVSTGNDAKLRVRSFLDKTGSKVRNDEERS
jgi:hypothetical protein